MIGMSKPMLFLNPPIHYNMEPECVGLGDASVRRIVVGCSLGNTVSCCNWEDDSISGVFCNSAVPARRLRTAEFVFLNLRRMGFKRRLSCSSASVPEEDADEGYARLEGIGSDLDRIDSMTVKDLRTLTRRVGIPTRGSKKELLSALKCFLAKTESATAGPNLLSAAEDLNPDAKDVQSKDMLLERKAKSSCVDNVQSSVAVSEISERMQVRGKRKKQLTGSTSFEDDSNIVTSESLSTKTEKVVDATKSRKMKSTSLKIQSEVMTAVQVGLPADSNEPWTLLAHKKPQDGWVAYNPRTMRPPPLSRDTGFVKLMSWNVNGLRALLKGESFSALELAQREDFDVLCLQETKIQEKDVEDVKRRLIDGYDNSYWTCSVSKLGYSGTAIISRIKPISVRYGLGILDHDSEGRLVTVEFDNFYLISAYVPNSGDGLKRLDYRVKEWDASLSNYMHDLEKLKPVILTGDLNCAHQEIDIFNPAGNRRSAGFTDEERESFEMKFLSSGFVDTFRKQHPGVVGYTYWGYRHGARRTNRGWRLDYFLVSESLSDKVYDSYIVPDVIGSDHCPIGLILKL